MYGHSTELGHNRYLSVYDDVPYSNCVETPRTPPATSLLTYFDGDQWNEWVFDPAYTVTAGQTYYLWPNFSIKVANTDGSDADRTVGRFYYKKENFSADLCIFYDNETFMHELYVEDLITDVETPLSNYLFEIINNDNEVSIVSKNGATPLKTEVFNTNGRQVISFDLTQSKVALDDKLESGIYIVRVSSDQSLKTVKVYIK